MVRFYVRSRFAFVCVMALVIEASSQTHTKITLPAATIGTGYAVELSIEGFELAVPYAVEVNGLPSSGELKFCKEADPSCSTPNQISGTPIATPPKTYSLSIVLTDANKKTTTVNADLPVAAALVLKPEDGQEMQLPPATENMPYQVRITLPGGVKVSGSAKLPNNLVVSPDGTIAGTPSGDYAEGEYHGTVSVPAAGGGSKNYRVKVRLYLSPIPVKIAQSCQVSDDKPPTVTTTLNDAITTISGLASVPEGCTGKLQVWTIDPASRLTDRFDYLGRHPTRSELQQANGNLLAIKSGDTVASDGTFTIQLSGALRGGQTVVVRESLQDSTGKQLDTLFSQPIPISSAGDWGRIKAYFTSGILLSQSQGSFSQSNLFLSFALDRSWRLPGPAYGASGGIFGVNTFFDTRLTAVPVTAQPCTTSSTATNSSQCPASSASGGGSNNFNTFLSTQKTAVLAVGAYLPFVMKSWTYEGVRNGLFIAPLSKVGFQTPTAPLNQSQAQAQSLSAGNSPGTVVPVNNTNFYNFYEFGGRIGHYAMPAPRLRRGSYDRETNEAPELVSYLDVAAGRFSNLETILNNGTHTRLYRLSLEGLLKVPATPLVIGLSANIGQESVGVAPGNVRTKAGDDLRFLFGAKFDVGKLTSYLQTHAF